MVKITKEPKHPYAGRQLSSEDKRSALLEPSTYPEHPNTIEMRETHMSWVFLTENMVYKLKKPVRRAFLDFSTLTARRWNCREEVRLNRRLAKQVYVGVVPLVLSDAGRLRLGGQGTVVDWLVKMRRLAEEQMLDTAIRRGGVDPALVEGVARLLTAFYAEARPVLLTADQYKDRLADEIETNRTVLGNTRSLDGGMLNRVCDCQRRFISQRSQLLCERVQERRIIEGHGDLRPEHVFLGTPPAVIDCLEFDRDLRILDPVDELAFLALECERMGDPSAGEHFLRTYREIRNDTFPRALVDFYKSCRAGLRARIAVWHLREPGSKGAAHWWSAAEAYLGLADGYMPSS